MRAEVFKDIIAGLIFVLVQVLLFQHLSLFGSTPDLLLIFLLWMSLKYDRIHLVLFAAGLGLFQDALFDFWGLHMFSKTLTFFVIYKVVNRGSESRLLMWQMFSIIFSAAFLHNLVFLGLSFFINAYATGFSPIIFLIGNSLYTATIGTILFVFKGN